MQENRLNPYPYRIVAVPGQNSIHEIKFLFYFPPQAQATPKKGLN